MRALRAGMLALAAGAGLAAEPLVVALPDGALILVESDGGTPPRVDGAAMAPVIGTWWQARVGLAATASLERRPGAAAEVRLPHAGGATAAVVVAGRWNWPDAAGVARVEAALGASIAVIVPIGDPGARIAQVPPPRPILPTARVSGVLAGALGEATAAWQGVPGWGALALPMAEGVADLADAVQRSRRTWRVPLLARAPWDAGGRGIADDPEGWRLLAVAARANDVPLLIASGQGSGLLSHPLGERRRPGRVPEAAAVAGGARYLLADAGADRTDRVHPLAAATWDEALLIGMLAGPEALRVCAVDPVSGSVAWSVQWDAPAQRLGPGWGAGAPAALTAAWRRGASTAASATAALAWAAEADHDRFGLSGDEVAALLAAAETDPQARQLLRRQAEDGEDLLRGRRQLDLARAPAWLRDLVVLRSLGTHGLGAFATWSELAQDSRDPGVLAALLARAGDARVFALLMARVQRIAEGRQPLPQDPALQHRLMATLCDDRRSGAALRQAGEQLLPRLAPLARGPVERYLERTRP